MTVLGIDPGPEKSAVVAVDVTGNDWKITPQGIETIDSVIDLLRDYTGIDTVAVECIQNYGMVTGQSVYETCFNIGEIRRACKDLVLPCHLYARPKIKAYLTGRAHGKDSDVRRALMVRFGGTKKGEPLHGCITHLWAACATAVYHCDGAKLGGWAE